MEQLDLQLGKVIDTHVHADHVTAMGALRDHTNCVTVMGEQALLMLSRARHRRRACHD